MATVIMGSDPMIALAEHQIEMDNVNADADQENLRSARNQEHAALEQQVQKLHEAADDVRTGALVQCAFSVAGCGAEFGAKALDSSWLTTTLKIAAPTLNALAAPAGRWTGEVPQRHDEADAKEAEARAADARSRAEEAEHHRDRIDQMSDRTLSSLDGIINSEAQGNIAVIANV